MPWFRYAIRASAACLLFASLAGAQVQAKAKPAADPETDLQNYLTSIRAENQRRGDVNRIYMQAVQELEEGKYREAEADFRTVYTQEPRDARGLEGVAKVYQAEGRPQDAISVVQNELRRQPLRTDLLSCFADVAVRAGSSELAASTLTNAIRRLTHDPLGRADLLLKLGTIDQQISDFPGAIAAFQQAVAVRPYYAKTGVALARAYEANGQNAEALDTYRSVLGVDPTDAVALVQRASTNTNSDPDITVACLELAIRLRPDDPAIAAQYAMSRPFELSLAMLQDLVARYPENSLVHRDLALRYLQVQDKARALDEAGIALKLAASEPDKSELQRMIANIHLAFEGQPPKPVEIKR